MKCTLCPRKCGAERDKGEKGICGCDNTLYVGRVAPHLWEEPCICGKNGSGTVFFSGCNLGCVFCQNGAISKNAHRGIPLDADGLADKYLYLQSLGVTNINLVTPTPWSDIIKKSLDIAWNKGLYLPVVYNCGGYESTSALKSLRGYISVYMPDFKYCDSELAAKYSKAADYPSVAIEAIDEMVPQVGEPRFDSDGMLKKGVIVRHLILPGYTEHSKKCLKILHDRYGDGIITSVMNQFTPFGNIPDELNRKITPEEYAEVLEYAEKIGMSNIYSQDEGTATESFIPDWL